MLVVTLSYEYIFARYGNDDDDDFTVVTILPVDTRYLTLVGTTPHARSQMPRAIVGTSEHCRVRLYPTKGEELSFDFIF